MIESVREGGNAVEPIRTDAMRAADIRAELSPLFDQVCDVLNRAKRDGLVVNFQMGADAYGRYRLQDLTVVRPL